MRLFLTLAAFVFLTSPAVAAKPNIVVILADDKD